MSQKQIIVAINTIAEWHTMGKETGEPERAIRAIENIAMGNNNAWIARHATQAIADLSK